MIKNGTASHPVSVRLRRRQQGEGSISLYLVYYFGSTTSASGKRTQVRKNEYLNLYLTPHPKTKAEKDKNREIERLAEAIKSRKEVELKNGTFGFLTKGGQGVCLLEYFREQYDKRKENLGNFGNWRGAYKHLSSYVETSYSAKILLSEIDADFMRGFKEYLTKSAKTTALQPLSSSSQNSYFAKLKACIKQAIRDDLLVKNPGDGIVLPRIVATPRQYLTYEELDRLAQTESKYDFLKKAFLFSCLTGLRWSDIHKLKWAEVQQIGERWRIVFHQKKTQGLQYHDISDQARGLLGDAKGGEDRVFPRLKYSSYVNNELQRWMMKAGITKHISFHCARHTYATLQLHYGTDIVTLSKMLGHSELKTTMIYAQIMDAKRLEAASRIPLLSL